MKLGREHEQPEGQPNYPGRESGVLSIPTQQIAQQLFDHVDNEGGQLSTVIGITTTTVKASKRERGVRELEISTFTKEGAGITMRLLKGRRGWQDNGAETIGGILFGSKVEPTKSHPSASERDVTLLQTHSLFTEQTSE